MQDEDVEVLNDTHDSESMDSQPYNRHVSLPPKHTMNRVGSGTLSDRSKWKMFEVSSTFVTSFLHYLPTLMQLSTMLLLCLVLSTFVYCVFIVLKELEYLTQRLENLSTILRRLNNVLELDPIRKPMI